MNRLLKSSKDKQRRNSVNIKFGMNIPCDHKEALMFDAKNVTTNQKYTELPKKKKIYKFDPFDSIGPSMSAHIPPSHTKIKVHFVYEYKQDWIYKGKWWPLETRMVLTLTLTTIVSSKFSPCAPSFSWLNLMALRSAPVISAIPT